MVMRTGTIAGAVNTDIQTGMAIAATANGITASRSAKIRALGYLREALLAPLLIRRRKKD